MFDFVLKSVISAILTLLLWPLYEARFPFDYVVVGGGTAGLTISTRLAQHGFQVAVIEAGGYYELEWPLSMIPGAAIIGVGADISTSSSVDWNFVVHDEPGANYRDIHYPRGKCLGGSSAVNFLMYQRPSKDTMTRWADLVDDPSYLFDNILHLFKKTVTFTPPSLRSACARALFNDSAFDPYGGPLHVSYPQDRMPFSTWVREGMKEVRIEEAHDFNSGSLMGHQFCTMTIRPTDGIRSSSESAFRQDLLHLQKSRNLRIFKKTLVKRVLFDDQNRAIGVEVKRNWMWKYNLMASREVILSAGAFQSPQLLMVSGVGPADKLEEHGIPVIANRPGVGENMWDHPFFGPSYPVKVRTFTALTHDLGWLLTQIKKYFFHHRGLLTNPSTDYLAFEKIPQSLRGNLSSQDEDSLAWFPQDWPEVEYLAASAYVGNFSNPFLQQPHSGEYGSIIGSLVAPTSRGKVTIQSDDTADAPIIHPNWLDTAVDQKIAVALYKRIRNIYQTEAMQFILDGPESFPGQDVQSDAEILDVIKSTLMTIYHAACTCKMGLRNDSMAVVDSRSRVFGVSGLRVVDASAFPILPPGHPQSTVYMLAEKIAADIIAS
ncbi:Dehydrogenase patE [Penicillium taxi]|uniref:Dehydrogenase patE n=1 Tax=Penicillium taxi TaxID=168475 RepID=UPI00254527EE|nr:Dehydrogenase patE [Penicillium taxi]KAJ5900092.1 Dehydrogenase patE [Penicillium taxi]